MALWKSPIFSDIRNKLGENVVFSMWKGRPYMRSYVTPSNPKSVAQTANRLHMAELVSAWQTNIKGTPTLEAAWNAAALSQLISGFNRFIKALRGCVITTVTLAHATFSVTLDSVVGSPAEYKLYAVDTGHTTLYEGPSAVAGTYTSADFTAWTPATGDELYLVDEKAVTAYGSALTAANVDQLGGLCYQVDESAGTITAIVLT